MVRALLVLYGAGDAGRLFCAGLAYPGFHPFY
ncbi:hypothetical protein LMG29542_06822 [Paraburkholderia humisilvae]|uniref:Uncharacterized protein n=1 Tax=Paraburkholderia humisilvae TaxID=627669 RepID=A0A6J5F036_9BURK|nr:hypothetical protein LMG29542_06822 [Paraburkholderia humisilvae]